MEVEELKHRMDDFHSRQNNTESKIESVLLMQHKLLQKLDCIDKILHSLPAASLYPPPPPPTTFHHQPSTPVSFHHHSSTPVYSPHQSTPRVTPPSHIHKPFQLADADLTNHTTTVQTEAAPVNTSRQSLPESLPDPVPIVFTGEAMPSIHIPKQTLADPDKVATKYAHKANNAGCSQFALKLAHHAYFGSSILQQYTVMGERGRLGLPRAELSALKTQVFRTLPQYWNDREKFEPLWAKCVDAINGACRREAKTDL